jgi:hypothetical protein
MIYYFVEQTRQMNTQDLIKQQEQIIAKAQYKLNYLKAWVYLEALEATAEVKLVDYLAAHYGTETEKLFRHKELTQIWSVSNRVKTVKDAISSYKGKADTKKNPEWAKEALKAAEIVDQYLNRSTE